MNRVIKFRAWHKTWSQEESEWLSPKGGKRLNGMQYVMGLWWGKSGVGHVHLHEWSSSILLSEVELMQFTGLLDKNGKEIYEASYLCDEDGNIGTVEFDAGHFIIRHANGTSDFIAERNKFEIVGNMYENPELLKV